MAAKVKIGSILKALREKKGITIARAAADAGMTSPALSYYERDEKDPSLEYAIKLADYYGVTLDELCGREQSTKGTFADVLRAYVVMKESGVNQEITFEDVHYSESKEVCEEDIRDYFVEEASNPGTRVMTKKAIWVIHNSALAKFMETYGQLSSLVEKEQLDQSVLDVWMEKQISDARKGDW